ncbi:MAG: hotdog domain-containing protein, partial [Nocardioidaceae bacterium]
DEGLFASYTDVQFLEPVRAGDVLEIVATVTRVGTRSRDLEFVAQVTCRGRADVSASAAAVLDPRVVAATARGTVVVPERRL